MIKDSTPVRTTGSLRCRTHWYFFIAKVEYIHSYLLSSLESRNPGCLGASLSQAQYIFLEFAFCHFLFVRAVTEEVRHGQRQVRRGIFQAIHAPSRPKEVFIIFKSTVSLFEKVRATWDCAKQEVRHFLEIWWTFMFSTCVYVSSDKYRLILLSECAKTLPKTQLKVEASRQTLRYGNIFESGT